MSQFEMQNMNTKPEDNTAVENNSEINKLDLESKKEDITLELNFIEETLKALENNEEGYEYADTGDSMMTIDSMFGANPLYLETLVMRKEASKKIAQGSKEEKKEGLNQAMEWVEKVKRLL